MKDYENILKTIRTLCADTQPHTDDIADNVDADNTDDTAIFELLYQHGCSYLLSKTDKPHPYTNRLNADALLNRVSINERFHSCQRLFEDLDAAAIPYAVIKGAVLSASAYKNPYSRHSGDMDILVNRENIDDVKRIMLRQGFVQGRVTQSGIVPYTRQELLFQSTMSHQIAPFSKATGNRLCPYIQVDINMDILWGESRQKADMSFILEHTTPITVCDVTVRKLTPEMEFIAMCLHHYKDMNSIYLLSQGNLKLKLFCDIYYYIKSVDLDAKKLYALCNRLKVSDYVYYCLYYTDCIFDDSALRAHYPALSSPSAERRLNCFGLAENEIRKWDIGFFERLFDTDMREYFQKTLSDEALNKIRMNEAYM